MYYILQANVMKEVLTSIMTTGMSCSIDSLIVSSVYSPPSNTMVTTGTTLSMWKRIQ